jgi:hypothetical protein
MQQLGPQIMKQSPCPDYGVALLYDKTTTPWLRISIIWQIRAIRLIRGSFSQLVIGLSYAKGAL